MNPIAVTATGLQLMSGMRLLQVDAEGELHVREIRKVVKPRDDFGFTTTVGYAEIWFTDGPDEGPHAEMPMTETAVVF